MFGKCTRKLMFRWGILSSVMAYTAIGAFCIIKGKLPATDSIRLSAIRDDYRTLSFTLPKLIDPIVMVVPVALLVWLALNFNRIVEKFKNTNIQTDGDAIGVAITWGLLFGAAGVWMIEIGGIWAVIIGSTITSGITVMIASPYSSPRHPLQSFIVEAVAVVVLWWGTTLLSGTIAGLIYTFGCLVLATITHFGLWWLGYGIYKASGPIGRTFERTMLSCDPKDH